MSEGVSEGTTARDDVTTDQVARATVRSHVDPESVRYARSFHDASRLALFLAVTLILLALTVWAQDAILGLEQDALALVHPFSARVGEVLTAAVQVLGVVGFVAGALVPLLRRRYRLLGYVLIASVLAYGSVALLNRWLDSRRSATVVNQLAEAGDVSQVDVPATGALAQLAATYVILAPILSTMWRRAAVATLATVSVLHLILSEYLPASLFLGLALGATVGWAILFGLGRPDARPTEAAIRDALTHQGLKAVRLQTVPSRSATAYFADLESGDRVFVKVRDDHQRANDLIFRVIRYVRMKDIGDETPFATPRRASEHEALGALRARDIGVRAPRLGAIADVADGAPLLAYDVAPGTPLDKLQTPPSDETLRAVWRQLAVMGQYGMAHRDLRGAKIFVDDDGSPWVVGFGRSDTAANPAQLHTDLAQLLVTLALVAGPERSVATAISVLGPKPVAEALPRLQTNAMAGTTRAALKDRRGLVKEVTQQVINRCGVEDVHYVELERISGKTLLSIVMLVAATYFLLPQFADLSAIFRQIGRANWLWAVPAAVMSVVTYVGAALSVAGAVPERLRAVPTTMAQVASSFAGLVAPAGVGGMALNVRFLQKSGVGSAVAVSSVGLNTVAGVVVHVLLLLLFVIWAGRSAFQSVSLPNPEVLWYGALVVAVLAVVALAFPAVRRILRHKAFPVLRRSLAGVATVVTRPGKLGLLLGGSALVTLGYIGALFASTHAFGGSLTVAQVGAVFLVGATVASVAPTPGGLGAMEAALVTGLVAAGLPQHTAVPTVFLYRLLTFWLPLVPGWVALRWLKHADYV